MHTLTLSLQRDDGTAELAVKVKGDDLAGRGSAWFSVDALSQFASDLEAMPLNSDRPPAISGGYWNDDATQLIQEHVHLSVRPLDRLGRLALRVKVFTPASNPTYAELGLGRGAVGDFVVDYELLAQLSGGLRSLIAGSESAVEYEVASIVAA